MTTPLRTEPSPLPHLGADIDPIAGRSLPLSRDVLVTAVGLAALCAELEAQGIDRRRVLSPLGLTPAVLDDPDARISIDQKIAFFRIVHRLGRDPAIGFKAARRQRLNDFGILGFAASAHETFEEALKFGIAHARICGSVLEHAYRREAGFGIVSVRDLRGCGEISRLVVEYSLAKMQRLVELVMERPIRPTRILLSYEAPEHADLYARVFDCDVRFGAGVTECRFEASVLETPCPNASELSRRMADEPCRRLLGSLERAEPAIVRSIRAEYLKDAARGVVPASDAIAGRLGLSRRTLSRRLADVGTNWQVIVDDIRGRMAGTLLATTDLTNDEIASKLGFADASSFGKSFKRWARVSPLEYRRRSIESPTSEPEETAGARPPSR